MTIFQWIATKFDKHLLQVTKISTPSVLLVEAIILITFFLFIFIFSNESRNRLFEDLNKLSYIEMFLFYLITGLGIMLAFLVNLIIKHFSASKFRLYDVIFGLLIYGSLLFITSKSKFSLFKFLIFICLLFFSMCFISLT
tara:strand:+ start:5571 stop:5990 length:420 start_codon:yes stop_codon:yes gene_type:complete